MVQSIPSVPSMAITYLVVLEAVLGRKAFSKCTGCAFSLPTGWVGTQGNWFIALLFYHTSCLTWYFCTFCGQYFIKEEQTQRREEEKECCRVFIIKINLLKRNINICSDSCRIRMGLICIVLLNQHKVWMSTLLKEKKNVSKHQGWVHFTRKAAHCLSGKIIVHRLRLGLAYPKVK